MPRPPDNDDPPSDPRPRIDKANRVLRFLRPPVMRFVRYEYQFEFANGPPVIIVRGDSEEETESSEETSSSATTTTTAAATSTTATAAAAAMGADGSTTGRSLSPACSVSELSISLSDISLSSLLQLMDAPVEFDSETDYDDDENSHVNEGDGHVNGGDGHVNDGGDEDRLPMRINTTAWNVFRTRL